MHESEFRNRLRAALGEAPDGAGAAQRAVAALRHRAAVADEPRHPWAVAVVAAALTVLVLAGLLGPRLLRSLPAPARVPGAAAQASPSATPTAIADCRVPVVVADESGARPAYTVGMVSLATGRFQADPAGARGLPSDHGSQPPFWYDPVLRRWLPVLRDQVSPDHGSYVYSEGPPTAARLHVHDVRTGADRTLWTTPGYLQLVWRADGIEATVTPPSDGPTVSWLVDPVTGARTTIPYTRTSMAALSIAFRAYGVGRGGGYGADGLGRPILSEGSRDPGARITYFVGGADGERIVIHDGVSGPDAEFDPTQFAPDGDRLWAVDFDAQAIWLWTERDGLRRFPITGFPRDGSSFVEAAGPCV